jgi:hypothetical protein
MCDVSIYVPSLPKDFFYRKWVLEVLLVFPVVSLTSLAGTNKGNGGKQDFNANTSQAQGSKKICEVNDECFGFKDVIFSDFFGWNKQR